MLSCISSTGITLFIFLFLFCTIAFAAKQSLFYPFESIYQFGDSLSDTGNKIRQPGATSSFNSSSWPYGMTYFHKPTGRYSDGLIVVDFFAKALNLPLLNPYLETNASFSHGVDFAVGGSTALDNTFFAERNISVSPTNVPLSQQMKWFKKHLESVSDEVSEREKRLKKSLIIMGEIGGCDINYALTNGWSTEEVKQNFVQFIVEAISNAVREAIQLGANFIVVPGSPPGGCLPKVLTEFPSTDPKAYDDYGCLRENNEFALFVNDCLQKGLNSLKLEFPDAVILYFDYFEAFVSLLRYGNNFGFDQNSLLKACCGIGGRYNYNDEVVCGSKGVKACQNPKKYIHWDGVHLTQEAYRHIADRILHDLLSTETYSM